ncbi:TlpA disulfide reductase family protein [Shewanella sp. UCD-KL12]|uniref:TlpA disulfide reductase family protein n=1 Tax=Shewanella sp. UCD-KL12 TaxID=1917163 RepID=UPI003566F22B
MNISQWRISSSVFIFLILLSVFLPVNPANAEPSLNVNVQSAQGVSFELNEYLGSVVYVDFWASWCGPCRKSFPWMNSMHNKYAAQGLKIVAINLDTDPKLAKQFLKEIQASFDIAYDADMQVASEFDIIGMPTSYLFNRKGELVAQHVGFYREDHMKYEAEIKRWLAMVDD